MARWRHEQRQPVSQHTRASSIDLIDIRQIVGIIVALERFIGEAEERGNAFVLSLLEKQHVRLKSLFERRVVSITPSIPR